MAPLDRVRALVAAARRLADPRDPLGREARALLPGSTGLSPENVELALSEILETHPTDDELHALVDSVEPAARAHVQLAANVFTAPLRAIALALAQSADVQVRASRREPVFTRSLSEASGAFEVVESLSPKPGDHLWAYGSDTTLGELEQTLPPGVVLHAFGSGFGLAVVGTHDPAAELALDIVPFDQRGCLSPRVAVVVGSREEARAFARSLAHELTELAERVPVGRLDDDERAESVRLRETLSYAGELFPAGPGWVALDDAERRLIPAPSGRNLVVVRSDADLSWLSAYSQSIVAVGARDALRELPETRCSPLGAMQRPRFDGPVDGRSSARARLL